MTPSSNTFLGDIFSSLKGFDAERLTLIHHLTGAMLRDARIRLQQPSPNDPYLRSFKFNCGHVIDMFIYSLDPLRLAYVDDSFRKEPCLSCLAWRLNHLLDYAVYWEPPTLKVDALKQLPSAEVRRWEAALALTDYLSDLPPEFRTAWQGLADDILGVLEQSDGVFWLQEKDMPVHIRILKAATLDRAVFFERYGRDREDNAEHRKALVKALEVEEMTLGEFKAEFEWNRE